MKKIIMLVVFCGACYLCFTGGIGLGCMWYDTGDEAFRAEIHKLLVKKGLAK